MAHSPESLPGVNEQIAPAIDRIYFFRSELGRVAVAESGYRYALSVVKVSETLGGAYLAFASEALAQRFLRWRPKVEIVCSTDLDHDTAFDFSEQPVVLFETEEQVDACAIDARRFPYEALLTRFSPDGKLLRCAAHRYEPPIRYPDTGSSRKPEDASSQMRDAQSSDDLLSLFDGPRTREQNKALAVTLVFVLISLSDGFLKIQLMREPIAYFWMFELCKWLLLPMALMWFLHRGSMLTPRDYGMALDEDLKHVLKLSPLPLLTLFPLDLVSSWMAAAALGFPQPPFSYIDTLEPLGPLWIFGALYMSVTAGLWESLFFLNLPWYWLSRGKSVDGRIMVLFINVSAAAFAFCHWENGSPEIIAAFAFGIGAAWWYLVLRTIWPVVIAHCLIDLYVFWPG